jgi:hypothetical protein
MTDQELRRKLINPIKNPRKDGEYIVQLLHRLAPMDLEAQSGVELRLYYVPDRLVVDADDYDKYLSYFETKASGYKSYEELGSDIIDDLNNELVPKWIHLHIIAEHAHTIHRVKFEERQPNWDNAFLLSRLGRT